MTRLLTIIFLIFFNFNLLYANAKYNIVVVQNTNELSQFNEVASSFAFTLNQKKNYNIKQFDLKSREIDDIVKEINKFNTNLIYAIGDRSAALLAEKTKNIPIIFSMILNYKNPKLRLAENKNVAGISLEVPAEITFMQLQLLVPTIKKVGIFYSERSKEIVDNIVARQAEFGLEIIAYEIKKDGAIEKAFRDIRKRVEAIYMVADPVIYTKDNTILLINECKKAKIPFIAYSDAFVKAGALMSVSPSYSTIGSQAASLAENILIDKTPPEKVGVVSPIGTFFVINALTSQEIGITTDENVLNFADKVYRNLED